MNALQLGPDFTMDPNVATRRSGLLGQPDTGKTNGLTVIAEGFLRLGVPLTIQDWKGDLWGLRSSADGLKAGFPVVIFGGDHADVDIQEGDGREIGHVVAMEHIPSIIDLSGFETDAMRRRFATKFLKAFLQAKAPEPMRTPHPLLFDEFQQFAPQRPFGDEVDLLSAVLSVFGLGRKRGIGVLWTALRAAQVAKSVVELTDVYLFMQTAGKNDLKSIEETLKRFASAEELVEIGRSLPRLGKGEVLVYSPAWLRMLEKHRFALRSTFDSSRTPEVGGEALEAPRALAKIDAPALAARIAKTREEREYDDPEYLRQELEAHKKTIIDLTGRVPEPLVEVKEVPFPILTERDRGLLENIAERLAQAAGIGESLMGAKLAFESIKQRIESEAARSKTAQGAALKSGSTGVSHEPTPRGKRQASDSGGPTLPRPHNGQPQFRAGAIRMLEACAQFEERGLTRAQVAALAKIKQGPTFSTYFSELRAAGFISEQSGRAFATSAGIAFLPNVPPKPRKPEEIISRWRGEFRAGAVRMLDIVVEAYPKIVTRAEISEGSGILPGPTFSTYLSELKRAELIDERNGGLYAVVLDLVAV